MNACVDRQTDTLAARQMDQSFSQFSQSQRSTVFWQDTKLHREMSSTGDGRFWGSAATCHLVPEKIQRRHRWFTSRDAITSMTFPFNWVTSDSLFEAKVIFHKPASSHRPYMKGRGVWKDGFSWCAKSQWGPPWYLHALWFGALIKGETWSIPFNACVLSYTCKHASYLMAP